MKQIFSISDWIAAEMRWDVGGGCFFNKLMFSHTCTNCGFTCLKHHKLLFSFIQLVSLRVGWASFNLSILCLQGPEENIKILAMVFLFIEGSVESYHSPLLLFGISVFIKKKPQTSTGWSWPRWREYCSPVFGLFPSQRCLLYSELVNVELLNVNLTIFTLYLAVVTYSEPVSQNI